MKIRIIFVDDEPNIMHGLKRNLFNMRNEWEMFFAMGSKEALDIMSQNAIDVIVTDMRMPEMDGAELLEQVRKLYPQVVRIILSGYSDNEMILRSVNVAHQFLIKPCNVETLKQTIERIVNVRSVLNNQSLIKIVTGIENLPSMPRLYKTLAAEIKSPDVSLQRIGDIVSMDVSMTTRVLQLVNSAFFSLRQKITDPHQAVILIGIDNLKALILFTHLFTILESNFCSRARMRNLWEHSLLVGKLAQKIIQSEWNDHQLAQAAFSAGMLHDIGKLVLMQTDDYWHMAKDWNNHEWHHCTELEYQALGTSHAEVGAYLLTLWGISPSIVEPVIFHHYPFRITGKESSVALAVQTANELSVITSGSDVAGTVTHDLEYLKALHPMDKIQSWIEICQQLTTECERE